MRKYYTVVCICSNSSVFVVAIIFLLNQLGDLLIKMDGDPDNFHTILFMLTCLSFLTRNFWSISPCSCNWESTEAMELLLNFVHFYLSSTKYLPYTISWSCWINFCKYSQYPFIIFSVCGFIQFFSSISLQSNFKCCITTVEIVFECPICNSVFFLTSSRNEVLFHYKVIGLKIWMMWLLQTFLYHVF